MKKIIRKIMSAIMVIAMLVPANMVLPMTASAYNVSNVPSYLFDAEYYSSRYSDLAAAFGTNKTKLYNHWINNGMKEGRSPSPVYDPNWYLSNNADLKRTFGNDYVALYNHFMSYGINEYRSSSPLYDGSYYKSHYADLQKAFGSSSKSYIEHFVKHGMSEARQASDSFNVKDYQSRYSDLQKAFGSDWKSYYYHYMHYGQSEGRDASPSGKYSPAKVSSTIGMDAWVNVSNGKAAIKESALSSSATVTNLADKTKISIYGSPVNDYYYMTYNNYTGYISKNQISTSNPDSSTKVLEIAVEATPTPAPSVSSSSSGSSSSASLPTDIYLKQQGSTTCTLAAATMMLRARKYLSGQSYAAITESSIRSTAWSSGLKWSFTYSGITVAHTKVSGISVASLKSLLDKHPEGIVLYCGNYPHAVFLTRYSGDTFYCADPYGSYSGKELTLSASLLGKKYGSQSKVLSNVTAYWYVKSY